MGTAALTRIETWTGAEARLLRTVALRMSVREFAAYLGLPPRTISKWEQAGGIRQPRPAMQAVLDAALQRADSESLARFAQVLGERREVSEVIAESRPGVWDVDSWSDDIERARLHVDRQDFDFAARLMNRWIDRANGRVLDDRALGLRARSLVVLGHLRRDQGMLIGPQSASRCYGEALAVFTTLARPRRIAQTELMLTVLREMSGQLASSAVSYRRLADDERLSLLDRARARLWLGTALTKGAYPTEEMSDVSIASIRQAIHEFEGLDEPDEWSVSQQKLALAELAAGNTTDSLEAMTLAIESRRTDSPLQQVRLDTAHAHTLCADSSTRDSGRSLLENTYRLAASFKLAHQMASIDRIREGLDRQTRKGR